MLQMFALFLLHRAFYTIDPALWHVFTKGRVSSENETIFIGPGYDLHIGVGEGKLILLPNQSGSQWKEDRRPASINVRCM